MTHSWESRAVCRELPIPKECGSFGEEGLPIDGDPFHSAKMHKGLSLIPEETANRLFDGKRMMVGISRRDGTPGRFAGSVALRATPGSCRRCLRPARSWTPHRWSGTCSPATCSGTTEPQMDGPVVHWWSKARAEGAEFIYLSGAEAVVLPWKEPIINPNDYPCSDPLAYRDEDPTTPDPCEVPVCWYGAASCEKVIPSQSSLHSGKTRRPVLRCRWTATSATSVAITRGITARA